MNDDPGAITKVQAMTGLDYQESLAIVNAVVDSLIADGTIGGAPVSRSEPNKDPFNGKTLLCKGCGYQLSPDDLRSM